MPNDLPMPEHYFKDDRKEKEYIHDLLSQVTLEQRRVLCDKYSRGYQKYIKTMPEIKAEGVARFKANTWLRHEVEKITGSNNAVTHCPDEIDQGLTYGGHKKRG